LEDKEREQLRTIAAIQPAMGYRRGTDRISQIRAEADAGLDDLRGRGLILHPHRQGPVHGGSFRCQRPPAEAAYLNITTTRVTSNTAIEEQITARNGLGWSTWN
jgi:hypothetical protein